MSGRTTADDTSKGDQMMDGTVSTRSGGDATFGGLVRRLLDRWWIVVAGVAAGVAVSLGIAAAAGDPAPVYESRALVVANSWASRIEGFARLAEAVSETNDFRELLESSDGDAFPTVASFDDSMQLVPVRDTVAVWVEADAPSAELAQRRANVAAEALVAEMTSLGDTVGTYTVEDRAPLPDGPTPSMITTPILAVLGALAGLLVGSAIAVTLPTRRRDGVVAPESGAGETAASGIDDADDGGESDEGDDGRRLASGESTKDGDDDRSTPAAEATEASARDGRRRTAPSFPPPMRPRGGRSEAPES